MDDKEEKSTTIPWLSLIGLIGVSGGLFLYFGQLTSSRPGGGEPRSTQTFDNQTINARLWQDPLGVALEDWQHAQEHGGLHSVTEFQERLIKKCFDNGYTFPFASKSRTEGNVKPLQVLAVMIPGGPYIEDVERRLRSRLAVTEGLVTAGYAPERDHEIGYFHLPWHPLEPTIAASVHTIEKERKDSEKFWFPINLGIEPARRNAADLGLQSGRFNTADVVLASRKGPTLLVPYEWYEPMDSHNEQKQPAHLLVLWLTDGAFRDAPIARLADFISWFRLRRWSRFEVEHLSLPRFVVLGPSNSGTLHEMVQEAQQAKWGDMTRQCLATTHIYSSHAAADESVLTGIATGQSCKELIELKAKRPGSQFSFERTLPLDDEIVQTLLEELKNRNVHLDIHPVAIISEEDTFHARALCSTFAAKCRSKFPDARVYAYTYLRGIDGKLPSDTKRDNEKKDSTESGDRDTEPPKRPADQPEGLSQAGDIRRLAQKLQELDDRLRKDKNVGLKAVGVLGSDVYDKLELLKALRPVLPDAVFFTNNLDARYAHPDEWSETHNLVVVSARDLSSEDDQRVPPFRDSVQTALFEATVDSIKNRRVQSVLEARIRYPKILEIGRNGPRNLLIGPTKSNWWSTNFSASEFGSDLSHLFGTILSIPLFLGGALSIGAAFFYLIPRARFITEPHIGTMRRIVPTIVIASVFITVLFFLFGVSLPIWLRATYLLAFGAALLAWIYLLSRLSSATNTATYALTYIGIRRFPNWKIKTGSLGLWLWNQRYAIVGSSWIAVPICAIVAVGLICFFYAFQNSSGNGEPFACFEGISTWPSITIFLFAALLSVHFIIKAHFALRKNADSLTEEFGLQGSIAESASLFGWEKTPLVIQADHEKRIDTIALWQRYLGRASLWMRTVRAALMTVLYMAALFAGLPLVGQFSAPPIRGPQGGVFVFLMMLTLGLSLFLTFFVIDAILLHDRFLKQLSSHLSWWPDWTFIKYNYTVGSRRPTNEKDLADYWDILLIAKRTEAVSSLIYYPFIVFSLLIVARLWYFDNWTWPLVLKVALSLHLALAVYAAWQLPTAARKYRNTVLERLRRRKRQAFMLAEKVPEALDTIINEVQSTHQGAFSNLWDQPAIRALLFPSSGIGLATLLQYLPR